MLANHKIHLKMTFLILFFGLWVSSCTPKTPMLARFSGTAQGTSYHISFRDDHMLNKKKVHLEIREELDRIDGELSNYRNDSSVEKINANETSKPIKVSNEIVALLKVAQKIYSLSDRCYDLTVGPLNKLWGFSVNKFHHPSNVEINDALKMVGMEKLELTQGSIKKLNPKTKIDLSSIAQGYTVKKISEILNKNGVENYLVELGGEMLVMGKKPNGNSWTVGIENPDTTSNQRVIKTLTNEDNHLFSVMTSGTYRHFFDENGKRYPHILDPRTGKPVEHSTVSVTVVYDDPATADAWSTAFLCLGVKNGLKLANQLKIAVFFVSIEGNKQVRKASETFSRHFGD